MGNNRRTSRKKKSDRIPKHEGSKGTKREMEYEKDVILTNKGELSKKCNYCSFRSKIYEIRKKKSKAIISPRCAIRMFGW